MPSVACLYESLIANRYNEILEAGGDKELIKIVRSYLIKDFGTIFRYGGIKDRVKLIIYRYLPLCIKLIV